MPPQLLAGNEYTPEQRAASLITRGTVRLSIGLEDAADLVQDLGTGLGQGVYLTYCACTSSVMRLKHPRGMPIYEGRRAM